MIPARQRLGPDDRKAPLRLQIDLRLEMRRQLPAFNRGQEFRATFWREPRIAPTGLRLHGALALLAQGLRKPARQDRFLQRRAHLQAQRAPQRFRRGPLANMTPCR